MSERSEGKARNEASHQNIENPRITINYDGPISEVSSLKRA